MDQRILPDLIVFLEVVRSGSLTKAAQRLNTVQSNVTARIRLLETAIGSTLLRRHARGVTPTAAGEAVLAIATRAEAVMDELAATFGKGRKLGPQKLRLGAIETAAASHLAELVGAFHRQQPNADVTVHADSSAALIRRVKDGELDAVFVSRRPGLAGFRERLAFRDRLVLVAPPVSGSLTALLAAGSSPLKVLVQRQGCSYTQRFITLLEAQRRRYRLFEIGTLEGIVRFVEAGLGVAAMPLAFVRTLAAQRSVKILNLPARVSRLELFLVARAERDVPAIVNQFVALAGADARR